MRSDYKQQRVEIRRVVDEMVEELFWGLRSIGFLTVLGTEGEDGFGRCVWVE
jgi:hypothetical protein